MSVRIKLRCGSFVSARTVISGLRSTQAFVKGITKINTCDGAVSMKKLARFRETGRCNNVRTEVDVQQGGVGSLHQDLLRRTVKSLIHEVHPVPHHGLDLLRVALKPTQKTSPPRFLSAFPSEDVTFSFSSSPSTSISRVGYMDLYCLASTLYLEPATPDVVH